MEELIGRFYAARDARDWAAVREMLAEDVAWHELGPEADYAGDHHGRERVVALLEALVRATEGTFSLRPTGFVATAEHVAASIRWIAARGGNHVEGNDLAVFRIRDGRIAEAWFHPDGFDAETLGQVFSL